MKLKVTILSMLMITCLFGITALAAEKKEQSQMNIEEKEVYDGVKNYVYEVYPNLNLEEKLILIDELYEEKSPSSTYNKRNEKLDTNDEVDVNEEVDEAYARMMEEEIYIVNLINDSGQEASIVSWEENLNYLKSNYEKIMNIDNVNIRNVDSYIEAYEWVLKLKDMPEEKISNKKTIQPRATYDYASAVSYAQKYYSSYNSNYPDWSYYGDCANFISQCLYAGGKTMKGTPGTQTAAENWANWFSKGTSLDTKNVSSTWRGADAFRGFWQENATSYKKFTAVDSTSYSYGYRGDAVSLLNSNGRAYHTLIIVEYSYPDFTIGAHTGNTITAKLSSKVDSNGFYIYNMR